MKVKPPTQLNCTSVSSLFKLRLRSPAQCQIDAPRLCATTTRQPKRGKGLRSQRAQLPSSHHLPCSISRTLIPTSTAQYTGFFIFVGLMKGLLQHRRRNSPGLGGNPEKCFSSLSSRSDCVRVQHPPTHAALHGVLLLLPARYWRRG